MKNNIMDKVENGIKKTAEVFNTIAGWAIVVSMILVVANIILRTVFKKPILGTYEYTGFLTAIVVGFSIAFCLVQDAHISIDFITQKFSKRAQNILGAATDSVMAVVMGVFTFYIFKYASKLMLSNSVSPTHPVSVLHRGVFCRGMLYTFVSCSPCKDQKQYLGGKK